MPSIDEAIARLKSQGKTLSTSKSLAKLVNARKAGTSEVYGNSGLKSPTSSGSLGGYQSSGGSDMRSQIADFTRMQQEAVAPAVSSLEGSKSGIQQRYSDLINQIKGNQQVAENRQTVTTQNELGRRGLTSSSGLAQQELTSALNPITTEYAGLIGQAGSEREQKLQDVANLIAQLKSQAAQTGISQGMGAYQFNQEQARSLAQQKAAQEQAAQDQAYRDLVYRTISLPESQVSRQNIQSQIAQRGSSDTGAGLDVETFLKQFNKATTAASKPSSTRPPLSSFME